MKNGKGWKGWKRLGKEMEKLETGKLTPNAELTPASTSVHRTLLSYTGQKITAGGDSLHIILTADSPALYILIQ